MKITGHKPTQAPELNSGKARDAQRGEGQSRSGEARDSASTVRKDKTLITHRIREAVDSTPDVRADRVAELRKQIASGEYRIDPDRLAENMLRESLREDIE
ncbi:MAG: flagellar biosynthesis anti-sigma factor FlgM [Deltaproteobacteria bacterium]|nr:flagellar biosynthesis anti-sigma factor FlgM [Deltaproteobacteria bacterium]